MALLCLINAAFEIRLGWSEPGMAPWGIAAMNLAMASLCLCPGFIFAMPRRLVGSLLEQRIKSVGAIITGTLWLIAAAILLSSGRFGRLPGRPYGVFYLVVSVGLIFFGIVDLVMPKRPAGSPPDKRRQFAGFIYLAAVVVTGLAGMFHVVVWLVTRKTGTQLIIRRKDTRTSTETSRVPSPSHARSAFGVRRLVAAFCFSHHRRPCTAATDGKRQQVAALQRPRQETRRTPREKNLAGRGGVKTNSQPAARPARRGPRK